MELILNDQFRRASALSAEKCGNPFLPGHASELIHSAEEKCRGVVVELLIHDPDREALVEWTGSLRAVHNEAGVRGSESVAPGILRESGGDQLAAAPCAAVNLVRAARQV